MTENNGDYTDYGYDDIYELTSEVKKDSGNNTLYSRSFYYDAVGNRTRMTKDGTDTYYCYDDNNKLTQYRVGGSSCTSGGQLYSYGYDSNGNTTSITRPDSTVETLVYDYENRMTQYKYPGQTVVGSYSYDGDGHRVQKVESSVTTNYLFDGERVQAEYDSNWSLQGKYTLEADSYYSPLISMRRSSTSSWHLYDGLGSTRKLINPSQSITDSYSYEAFGDSTASSGSTVNPYRYVGALGYHYSSAVPLLHVGARWYSPGIGRFMTQDPVGERMNWYAYVGNKPVLKADPSGEIAVPLLSPQPVVCDPPATSCLNVARRKAEDFHRRGMDYLAHCFAVCEASRCTVFVPLTSLAALYLMNRSENDPYDKEANKIGAKCAFQVWHSCEACCRRKLPYLSYLDDPRNPSNPRRRRGASGAW